MSVKYSKSFRLGFGFFFFFYFRKGVIVCFVDSFQSNIITVLKTDPKAKGIKIVLQKKKKTGQKK